MNRGVRLICAAVLGIAGIVVTGVPAYAATGRVTQTGRIVDVEPASNTPDILDGTVNTITEVGDWIVVGGTFTQAHDPGNSPVLDRHGLLAFDKDTGRISTTFDPEPNGTVYTVQAAPDGRSVYVGGAFSAAGGGAVSNLFEADVATGTLDPDFTAATLTGQVRDLEVADGRLWVAGKFTHVGGHHQPALATLDATTGRFDPYFRGVLSGTHNDRPGARTNVLKIATNPQGTALMAVGNFMDVDGQSRPQIARFDIGGAGPALSTWRAGLYAQACSWSFETNMTDVEFSPDGTFFVVSTTGAYGGSASNSGQSGCDVVARWENTSDADARPTWTAYTGGDTTWTVEVTDDVVYAGGHQRWQNNPTAGDQPGQGAVSREGIAALDVVNGLPYSWNPTRARGKGVEDMLATDDGLYVGSDTTLIGPTDGNRYHARIARMPLASGVTLPERRDYQLPVSVDAVAAAGSSLMRRGYDGESVTSTQTVADGADAANAPAWSTSVGAFEVDGQLYVAQADGTVTRRSFDGSRYGVPTVVDAADELVRQSTWHDQDVPTLTSLFYWRGRMYYTRAGQSQLYSRAFEIEDGVVGQQRFTVPGPAGVALSSVRGAFVADGHFYYADTSGRLFRTGWNDSGTSSGPTGSPTLVSGPATDGQNWASRTLFVEQTTAHQDEPPAAALVASCTDLTCSLDATASTDPDGQGDIASYSWDFGDGSARGTGATVTHDYATAGDRTVTLTVTDAEGASDTTTSTVSPTAPADPVSEVGFVAAAASHGNRTHHRVTIPAQVQAGDRLLLLFTANTSRPTYTDPSGWTSVAAGTGSGIVLRAYTRVATAADAGSEVTITSSGYAKSNLTIASYRSTSGTPAITAAQTRIEDGPGAVHTAPPVTVADDGSWVLRYWSDKSAATTSWTVPAGQTVRSTAAGSRAGHISSLLTDGGGPVGSGPAAGLEATSDCVSSRGAEMTLVLH